jgi:hypothetical protein
MGRKHSVGETEDISYLPWKPPVSDEHDDEDEDEVINPLSATSSLLHALQTLN